MTMKTTTSPFMIRLGTGLLGLGLLAAGAVNGAGAATENQPEMLPLWEEQMISEGTIRGEYLLNASNAQGHLDAVYYDGQRVFMEIAEYTGDAEPWNTYADAAAGIYRDKYLAPNDNRAAGYMRFPHGLYMDWERNGNEAARTRLLDMREQAVFSNPEVSSTSGGWYQQRYSREIAYAIENNVLAEKAGAERNIPRMDMLLDMALGHIDQWITGNFIDTSREWSFVQSFMTGLTASALIDYQEHAESLGTPDHRIQPAIASLADWLWTNMWVADVSGSTGNWGAQGGLGFGAFRYVSPATTGVGTESPAPNLNMLIAPLFAWLYKETGDQAYLDKADQIFDGGVALADIADGKRFNQNYRTSFTFLRFREAGVALWGG